MTGRARSAALLALAALPFLLDWGWKVFVEPRPFWAGLYDPELIYLNEGLGLLRGDAPEVFDRPGIPVQLLSAGLVAVVGADPLAVDRFRLLAYVVAALLTIAGIALLQRTILRGAPAALVVAGPWLFFLCPQALDFATVWSPEILYLPVGAVLLAALHRWLERPEPDASARTLALGAALGLAVSLKFTFLAWVPAVVAAVVARTWTSGRGPWREAVAVLGAAAAAFALLASYLLPRTGAMLEWLWRLASRSGEYGSGPSGLPDGAAVASGLLALVLATKKWHFVLGVLLAAALVALSRRDREDAGAATRLPLAVFASCALAGSCLLSLRNPQARYLLTNGLIAIVLLRLAAESALRRDRPRLVFGLTLAVGLLLGRQLLQDVATHRRVVAAARQERTDLEAAVRANAGARPPIVAYSYRVPIPSYALHAFAQSEVEHRTIFAAYPTEAYVDWNGDIRLPPGAETWDLLVVSTVRLASLHEPTGPPLADIGEFTLLARPAKS